MTTQINKSLNSLVKYNNGSFKSEKQAAFFLSMADNGEIMGETVRVYNNWSRFVYVVDAQGVIEVKKMTEKKGLVTVWVKDTTNKWQEKNNERAERKALAEWNNKARTIVNKWKIDPVNNYAFVSKFLEVNQQVIISRHNRIERLEALITEKTDKLDQLLSKGL